MKLSIVASLLALSSPTVLGAAAIDHKSGAVDKVIIYGASYTDNGNVYKHSGFPPSPPYYHGRFSDGPTWAEYFAEGISHHVSNNGYGGATTNNEDVYSEFNGYIVPGLKQQIDTIETYGTKDSLYMFEIAYNDLNALLNPTPYHLVNKNYTYQKAAQNVVDGIKALQKKYNAKKFAFFNVVPFDQWPVIPKAGKPKAKAFINTYNAYVEALLKKEITGAELKFYDAHTWFEEWLANPGQFGLSTTNGPCDYGIGNLTAPCTNSDKHFFFDSYHPQAKVHRAWGEKTLAEVKPHYNL